MNRKLVLLMAALVWGISDYMFGYSLRPLIGQVTFGAVVLYVHWDSNK